MTSSVPGSGPLKYKRLLVKLSGEALMGAGAYGVDMGVVNRLAKDVSDGVAAGCEIALVVGGGNIFRGLQGVAKGMDRATGDYMGMLATVMNALAFQNALEHIGTPARVLSAIPMPTVCESFTRPRAMHHLSKKRVVIFAAGTGNPFFTTDTAAALRGMEINAELVLKATKVDGVYSADPKKDKSAVRYKSLTFDEAIIKNLKVMDATALTLCRDQKLPICVFSIFKAGALTRVVLGEDEGTLVYA